MPRTPPREACPCVSILEGVPTNSPIARPVRTAGDRGPATRGGSCALNSLSGVGKVLLLCKTRGVYPSSCSGASTSALQQQACIREPIGMAEAEARQCCLAQWSTVIAAQHRAQCSSSRHDPATPQDPSGPPQASVVCTTAVCPTAATPIRTPPPTYK
jgi:hypothetical protein